MMKSPLVVLSAALLFPGMAAATLLGPADPYNVFAFSDFSASGSDVEGRMAVGGNVTLEDYSVGLKSDPAQYSLVSGGDVSIHSASVNNGGIFASGDMTLSSIGVHGDATAVGNIRLTGGSIDGNRMAWADAANPIDFAAAQDELTTTSADLAGMSVNGTADIKPWGSIYLNGGDGLNVFSLTAEQLAASVGMYFNLGTDATAIINVSGTANDFSNFGLFDYFAEAGSYGQMLAETGANILFNFFETETLSISGIGVIGSILAPYADLNFNNGVIHGSVVADSMSGSGQYNYNPFAYGTQIATQAVADIPTLENTTTVPEPGSLALLGLGAALMLGARRR